MELPPHARRIQSYDDFIRHLEGTTSACAENTQVAQFAFRLEGNYLRMRGEYFTMKPRDFFLQELPPHARRILDTTEIIPLVQGTTSACAENTTHGFGHFWGDGNYLRMRGEYCSRCMLK